MKSIKIILMIFWQSYIIPVFYSHAEVAKLRHNCKSSNLLYKESISINNLLMWKALSFLKNWTFYRCVIASKIILLSMLVPKYLYWHFITFYLCYTINVSGCLGRRCTAKVNEHLFPFWGINFQMRVDTPWKQTVKNRKMAHIMVLQEAEYYKIANL